MPRVRVEEEIRYPDFIDFLEWRKYKGWAGVPTSWKGYPGDVIRYTDQDGHCFEIFQDGRGAHLRVFIHVPPTVIPEWLSLMINDYNELLSKWKVRDYYDTVERRVTITYDLG